MHSLRTVGGGISRFGRRFLSERLVSERINSRQLQVGGQEGGRRQKM